MPRAEWWLQPIRASPIASGRALGVALMVCGQQLVDHHCSKAPMKPPPFLGSGGGHAELSGAAQSLIER